MHIKTLLDTGVKNGTTGGCPNLHPDSIMSRRDQKLKGDRFCAAVANTRPDLQSIDLLVEESAIQVSRLYSHVSKPLRQSYSSPCWLFTFWPYFFKQRPRADFPAKLVGPLSSVKLRLPVDLATVSRYTTEATKPRFACAAVLCEFRVTASMCVST